MKLFEIVKYSAPQPGEENFRFRLLEIDKDATPPRALIELICDYAIKPIESVSPDDICAC